MPWAIFVGLSAITSAVCAVVVAYSYLSPQPQRPRGTTRPLGLAASGRWLLTRVPPLGGAAGPRRQPLSSRWHAGAIAVPAVLALTMGCHSPAAAVLAEDVRDTWRSPFGAPHSVAVNPADGSCWALTGASVMHLAADGTVLKQIDGFWQATGVIPYLSVNPRDGSCWVPDMSHNQIVHLAADGAEIWRGGGFKQPKSVSVDPEDGSCWVADYGNNQVVHLAADGRELWRGGGFKSPTCVSVSPTEGSCWVADYGDNQVVHLAADGRQLWRGEGFKGPESVSVNPTDGSCWAADLENDQVVHLAEDGTQLWRGRGFIRAWSVSVNPNDGSCWVACAGKQEQDPSGAWPWVGSAIVHLSQDGTELWRGEQFHEPHSVSVNPADGSCWVANWQKNEVVHLAKDGTELCRRGGLNPSSSLPVSPRDGSCWAADRRTDQLVHLGADGAQLWRGGKFGGLGPIAVNPTDGSCWVVDYGRGQGKQQVVHLAADGSKIWRGGEFKSIWSLSVNPSDGSCWLVDREQVVVHLARDGSDLWRGGKFSLPTAISVNAEDGSCWVADQGRFDPDSGSFVDSVVVHLGADGTELVRVGGFARLRSVSANPTDGSCWVADEGRPIPDTCGGFVDCAVVHLAEDGTELWRGESFDRPQWVSVNPSDGSCWVANTWNNQVVHLAADGTELWRRGGFCGPTAVSVNSGDGSCWVADFWNSQLVRLVVVGERPTARVQQAAGESPPELLPPVPKASSRKSVRPAPDFSFTVFDGSRYSLAELKGKPVVLNFWHSTCRYCPAVAAYLEAFHQKHRSNGLVVLGVTDDDSEGALKQKAQALKLTYAIAISPKTARAYDARAIPMTFFIDREGNIASRIVGARPRAEFEAALEKIL